MNRNAQLIAMIIVAVLPAMVYGQTLKSGQECFPEKQSKLVYDEANVLDASSEESLNRILIEFNDSTSNQLAVVIVPDLCGMDKAQFAIELGEAWGVGRQREDNGIIFLVKPKNENGKGQVFIAVGRGLEGVIPDITAKQIIENEVIPAFKLNLYDEGIKSGCTTLMALAKGEFNSDAYAEKKRKRDAKGGGIMVLLVLLIIGIVLLAKMRQASRYAATNNIGFWAAWALINAASSSHRGYYSNFSSGRGGFGGGGGFSGFGGGSFGGGGAGGSW